MNELDFSRAQNLAKKRKFQEALQIYQEIINTNPQNSHAYQDASIILGELKRYQEALEMSTKALELDSSLIIPHVTMAYIYDGLGDKEKSRSEAKNAVDKNPASPEALCCMGIILLKNNERDDAKLYLENAIKANPSFYWAHYSLMAIYQNEKDPRKFLRQTAILFRLKPTAKSLFRLIFILSRFYRIVPILILALSAFFSPLYGTTGILIITLILMAMWFVGGIYIGLMAEIKQPYQLFINFLAGLITGILGLILYLATKYFLGELSF